MSMLRNLTFLLVLSVGLAGGPAFAEAARPLHIVPVPREMTRGVDIPLGTAAIVTPPGASAKFAAAAGEINQRVDELGGKSLPVLAKGSKEEAAFQGKRIELSVGKKAGDLTVPAKEQGYVIDASPKGPIRLVGYDEQGMFWAAISFRRMLERAADGSILVLGAQIRDWPDYLWRMMGHYTHFKRSATAGTIARAIREDDPQLPELIERYLEDGQKIVDFHVRLKYNLCYKSSAGTRYDEFVKSMGSKEKADRYLATVKRLHDYAWNRGLAFSKIISTNIGSRPADSNDPEISRCVLHPSHNRYFCWSLDEHNRRKAEETAKFFYKGGWQIIYVHAADGGGYDDPAHWSKRCEHCRKRWGDDRAAADSHVYGFWHRAFEEYAPGVTVGAVIYPYSCGIITRPNDPNYKKTIAYWKRMQELMPAGMGICLRENNRPNIDGFYEIFEGRPILLYWMPETSRGVHRWRPLLSSRITHAKTFFSPGRENLLFAKTAGATPMVMTAAISYMWNTEFPASTMRDGYLELPRDGVEPKEFFDKWLPYFASYLYGEKIGPDIAPLFRGCISVGYALQPDLVADACSWPNTAKLMASQYASIRKAAEGMARAWRTIETEKGDVLNPGSEAFFYGMTERAARILGYDSYHTVRMRAAEALARGEDKKTVAKMLEDGLVQLRADTELAKRLDARVEGKPMDAQGEFYRWSNSAQRRLYDNPDYEGHIAEIESLLSWLQDGEVFEMTETAENAKAVRWLVKDASDVRLGSSGDTKVTVVDYPRRAAGGATVQGDLFKNPGRDGFRLEFDPIDGSEYFEDGWRIRFYINAAPGGAFDFRPSLESRDPQERDKGKARAFKRPPILSNYVTVDGIEATWQLVDIPLRDLLPRGHTEISGFNLAFAQRRGPRKTIGPIWISSLYLSPPVDLERRKVKVVEAPGR